MKRTLTRIISKCIIPSMVLGCLYFSIPRGIYAEDKSFFEENKDNPIVNVLGKLSDTRFGKGVEGLRRKLIDEWAIKQGTGKTIDELQEDAKKAMKEFMDTINTEEPKDERIVKYIIGDKKELPTNYEEPAWSPDGKKIAFISRTKGSPMLHVINLENGKFENLTNKNLIERKKFVLFDDIWDKSPSWSPDGKQIAFASSRDGAYDIYVISADGRRLSNLTNTPEKDSDPCWSPDGKKIAFASKGGIFIIDADGSNLKRLSHTFGGSDPSWSPDGKKIIFELKKKLGYDENIYVINADGSGIKLLTKDRGSFYKDPAWSPDGKRIAFSSDKEGLGVYIMDTDGNRIEKLADGWIESPSWSPDSKEIVFTLNYSSGKRGKRILDKTGLFFIEVPLPGFGREKKEKLEKKVLLENLTNNDSGDENPVWSPDSKKIAFTSNRDGNDEIYVMDADGSDVKRLTNNPAMDLVFSWSPDGKKIAFVSDRDGNSEVYTMNVDGSDVKNLTRNRAGEWGPSWSPDGKKIVFSSDRSKKNKVYVMNADGSDVKNLTGNRVGEWGPSWSPDGKKIVFIGTDSEIYSMDANGEGVKNLTGNLSTDDYPCWSSDGKKIAFSSTRDGNYEIYVMDADGSDVKRLTNNPADDISPSWSPDGKKIAFTSNRNGNREIYIVNADGEM